MTLEQALACLMLGIPVGRAELTMLASAIEAVTAAETPKSGSVHEGAGPKDIAQ